MFRESQGNKSWLWKILLMPWGWILRIVALAIIGFIMLTSAAKGHWHPWAWRQALRFGAGIVLMLTIACQPPRLWWRCAYEAYGICFILLISVEIMGFVGMGARRWLDLYLFQVQPSELMKIAVILALARYIHEYGIRSLFSLRGCVIPLLMIIIPAVFVMRQPDLGTAIILITVGISLLILGGIAWSLILPGFVFIIASAPIAWHYLKPYQKKRILIFLNPEQDPLGAGYHILQSMIALGSGGVWGKGFLQGTQSHLDFLPEKQTDFVFGLLGEEWGFVGSLGILLLYGWILAGCLRITLRSRTIFGHLICGGVMTLFGVHALANMGMVMGLLPVVGIPLPLLSYGGTSLLTFMIAFGLMLSIDVHPGTRFSRAY